MISKGTQIRILVDGTSSGNGWSARTIPTKFEEDQKTKKNNYLSFQVDSPSDAIIGKYHVSHPIRTVVFISQLPISIFHSYYWKFVQEKRRSQMSY